MVKSTESIIEEMEKIRQYQAEMTKTEVLAIMKIRRLERIADAMEKQTEILKKGRR